MKLVAALLIVLGVFVGVEIRQAMAQSPSPSVSPSPSPKVSPIPSASTMPAGAPRTGFGYSL